MSEHVTPWMGMYLDGELSAERAAELEAHLQTCPACQGELEAQRALSALVRFAPVGLPTEPPEAFAERVLAALPEDSPAPGMGWLRKTWQWAPLGLFGAWAFGQAALLVAGWLFLLSGLFPSAAALLKGLQPGAAFTSALAWFNPLSLLDLSAVALPPVGVLLVVEFGISGLIGALFLSWLASWYVSKRPAR